jgi:hypothetical protein
VIESNAEVDAWEIAPRFSELLANTGIQFLRDRVKMLHPADHLGMNGSTGSCSGGTVVLESGLLIEYDWYCFIHPLPYFCVYSSFLFIIKKKNLKKMGSFSALILWRNLFDLVTIVEEKRISNNVLMFLHTLKNMKCNVLWHLRSFVDIVWCC